MKKNKFTAACEIHFSYGHRLMNYKGKCARLHGHNGRAVIEVSASALDKLGMVVDFYKIKESLGAWIQNTLDHQMILCDKDPLVPLLKKAAEPVVLMKKNPTAESMAEWIFREARRLGLPVSKVTLWETGRAFASYQE